jgi:predicted TIM-barrel fold metal-dependent hydrolase
MRIIDSDSQIEEAVELWDCLEPEEAALPQVLGLFGTTRMMVFADIPHGEARERSMDIICERTDLTEKVKENIFGENGARFYDL